MEELRTGQLWRKKSHEDAFALWPLERPQTAGEKRQNRRNFRTPKPGAIVMLTEIVNTAWSDSERSYTLRVLFEETVYKRHTTDRTWRQHFERVGP